MTTLDTPATTGTRATAALPLLGVSLVANLLLLGVGSLLGAAMTVDNAGTLMTVGVVEVALASLLPLALAIVAYVAIVPRVDLVGRVWTPTVVVLTLLSLGGVLGASDLTTGLVLGTMHLVVGSLAAFGLPARAGR